MQYFYPFYDPFSNVFCINQCFDYELDEYRGSPLARNACLRSEEEVIEYVTAREDQLPRDVVTAFQKFKATHHNTYHGILD